MSFNGTHWSKMPNRDEILAKINKGKVGRKQSKETIEKRVSKFRGRVSPMYGRKQTEEAKQKISESLKGNKYNLGNKHSKETKQKMKKSAKRGIDNNMWKGDEVGYVSLHDWVSRNLGKPTTCEFCGKKDLAGYEIHWANKSREYKRDVDDWIRLCASCHHKYDKTYENRNRDILGRFI